MTHILPNWSLLGYGKAYKANCWTPRLLFAPEARTPLYSAACRQARLVTTVHDDEGWVGAFQRFRDFTPEAYTRRPNMTASHNKS